MKKLLLILFLLPLFCKAQLDFSLIMKPASGPTVSIDKGFLVFSNQTGSPSAYQVINTVFSALTSSNGGITVPSFTEISLDNGSTWSGTLSGLSNQSTAIRARSKGSNTAGSYGPTNIVFTIGGVSQQTCSITATVSSSTPTLTVTPSSISTFSTTTDAQSTSIPATVNGSNLLVNDTVNCPAGYVVSVDGGSTFATAGIIFQTGGSINSYAIYYAIAGGQAIGNPSGTSTHKAGAATANVSLSGTVTSSGASIDTTVEQFSFSLSTVAPDSITEIWGHPNLANITVVGTHNYQPVTFQSWEAKWDSLSGQNNATNTGGVTSTTTGVPVTILPGYWFENVPTRGAWNLTNDTMCTISGLNPAKHYKFIFYNQRNSANHLMTVHACDSIGFRHIGLDTADIDAGLNTTALTTLKNLLPDASGKIRFGIKPKQGNPGGNFAYMTYLAIIKQVGPE